MKRRILLLLAILGLVTSLDAQIPTNGLVAAYPFNGNALDESVNVNNGIVDGAVLTTDRNGVANSAYWFDGIDDAIRITGGLPITNEFTISFWAYSENTSGYHNIICDGSSAAGGADFLINFRDDNIGIRADKNAPLNYEDSSPPELQNLGLLNNWVHVAWVMTPTASTVYLNGTELLTINTAGSNEGYHDAFSFIGARQVWGSPDYFFAGTLDDIFIYDRALNSDEITTLSDGLVIGEVTDIDANTYSTVRIGHQVWMQENLKTTRYSDGTAIPYVTDNTEWSNLTTPAYCWYDNNEVANRDIYGAIYNWHTIDVNINGNRNVCPDGWHMPVYAEWSVLVDYLGGPSEAAGKLKEAGLDHWLTPNTGATNESGFTALPAGFRGGSGDGNFFYQGTAGGWWFAQGSSVTYYTQYLEHDNTNLHGNVGVDRNIGFSLRCLQDVEYTIRVESLTIDEGQPVELPVSLSYVPEIENIISYQFDIDYDESTLEYTGNDLSGTIAEGGTVEVNSTVAGQLSVSYMNSTPLEGEGQILVLQFNSLMTDTTELLISNAYLNTHSIDNLENGQVIIRDITPPVAALTYNEPDIRCGTDLILTATFSEAMLAGTPVIVNMNGAVSLSNAVMTRESETVYSYHYPVPCAEGLVTVSLSNGTDLWGNGVLPVPSSGESFSITGLSPGDVDDDGNILAYDAALTLQHSVGLDPLPIVDPLPWENWRDSTANVDRVAGITANDAGMILQYSAGMITNFSGGGLKSAPQGFISMRFTEEGIILYSSGHLLGLNISMTEDIHILGTPEVLADGLMTAFNIDENNYKIGLCTTTPPDNGEAILKIPYHEKGYLVSHMIVNTRESSMPLNITTDLEQMVMDNISVYPNPASSILRINGLPSRTEARVYNALGNLMQIYHLENYLEEIDVSNLSSGLYILKLDTEKVTGWKRFIKE